MSKLTVLHVDKGGEFTRSLYYGANAKAELIELMQTLTNMFVDLNIKSSPVNGMVDLHLNCTFLDDESHLQAITISFQELLLEDKVSFDEEG